MKAELRIPIEIEDESLLVEIDAVAQFAAAQIERANIRCVTRVGRPTLLIDLEKK